MRRATYPLPAFQPVSREVELPTGTVAAGELDGEIWCFGGGAFPDIIPAPGSAQSEALHEDLARITAPRVAA